MLFAEKWQCPLQCLVTYSRTAFGCQWEEGGEGEAVLGAEGAQSKMNEGCTSFALESHWVRSGHAGLSFSRIQDKAPCSCQHLVPFYILFGPQPTGGWCSHSCKVWDIGYNLLLEGQVCIWVHMPTWCHECQSAWDLWASSSSSSFRWEKKPSSFWWPHSRCHGFHLLMQCSVFEFETLWNKVLHLLLPVHLRSLFWGLTCQLCIKQSCNGAGDIQHLYIHPASRKLDICVIKEVFPQQEQQFSLLAAETQ